MLTVRIALVVYIISFFTSSLVAQGTTPGATQFIWYNPMPNGSTLNAAVNVGGFVVAGGDRGNALQNQSGTWNSIYNFLNVDITSISSPTFNTVFMTGTGASPGLYRSTNSGFTWNQILPDTITAPLKKVCFGNQSIAILASVDGMLWKTLNEGNSWQRTASPSRAQPTVLKSVGTRRFFYATNAGGLFYSHDYGFSFTPSNIPTSQVVQDITFRDTSSTGYACTAQGAIYKTLDRGNTWTLNYTSIRSLNLSCIKDLGNGIVLSFGNDSKVFTFNSATSWGVTNIQRLDNPIDYIPVTDTIGYLFDKDGDIFSTTNFGGTFTLFNTGFYSDIKAGAIRPNLSNEIMLVGSGGSMYTGQTTLSVSQILDYTQFPTQRNLNGISKGIQQISPIVVGDSGNIFRSSSPAGSIIWTKASTPTINNLKSISGNQGYILAVGENGTILRSMNQGSAWSALPSQGNYTWNDVFLLEQSNNILDLINRGVGLVIGSGGKVLRYTSFGNTVSQIDLGSSENLLKINAVAGGKVMIGSSTGKVFVSSDYGQSFYVSNTFAGPIRAITGFRSNEIQVIDGNNFIHHLDEFVATSVDYIPTTIPINGAIYAEVGVGAGLSGGNIVFGNYGNLLSTPIQ
jgi:photosystem II stability/assembly factor-like uncharacterized protein